MSEDADEEAFREEMAAFQAKFRPEAFQPIALALGVSTEQPSLEGLREWLLPDLYSFYSSCTTDPRARARERRRLTKRSEAAAALLASIKPAVLDRLGDLLDEPFRRRFTAILERWADPASVPPYGRRRPKEAFRRDLVPGLVWVYEHITEEKAKKPYWLGDSRIYGGAFYRFACAVRSCLYDRLPEVRAALSSSDDALAQELQDHWPESGTATG
jgi:hypothetical protein